MATFGRKSNGLNKPNRLFMVCSGGLISSGHRQGVNVKSVSLFSGCGGFCEGVELAGFEVAVAVEMDSHSCMTYRANFPRTPLFEGDIHDFLAAGSNHLTKYKLENVDLVFGGPPCQGYSQIGPRDLLDGRNELYLQFARVLKTLRPRMFLMENVPNLLLMEKGHFRDAILAHLRSIGYRNSTFVKLSAADYGGRLGREYSSLVHGTILISSLTCGTSPKRS